MIVRKTIPLKGILLFAGHHFVWLIVYMLLITILNKVVGWHWIAIPWLPVALIGTAVAFYVPFEGQGTDVPMLSICRTIEIDLLQMLGETDLPKPIQPVHDVLM